MRVLGFPLALLLVISCSGGGDRDGSGGGGGGGGGGGSTTEPVCFSAPLTSSIAGEKVNAAWCFGFAYVDDHGCRFDLLNNVTWCDSATDNGYYVVWSGLDGQGQNTRGQAFDWDTDTYLADIYQDTSGVFVIEFADGDRGNCAVIGDVATLCLE